MVCVIILMTTYLHQLVSERQGLIVFRNAIERQARCEDHVDEHFKYNNCIRIKCNSCSSRGNYKNLIIDVNNGLRTKFLRERFRPEEEYSSSDNKFASMKEEDKAHFLYGDDEVDLIFFKDSDTFDDAPKFDSDGYDFVKDNLVFGDDDFIIEMTSHSKSPQVLEEVVGDAITKKCYDEIIGMNKVKGSPPRPCKLISSIRNAKISATAPSLKIRRHHRRHRRPLQLSTSTATRR
ncbi:hypothetical protein Syun_017438 [Stephania yunnanensis]|uniref:Uncharacterized protein n=1 Tax=Stephania yunnanensis TaxID=152371 RepID=A0AAP0J965_9MAGN